MQKTSKNEQNRLKSMKRQSKNNEKVIVNLNLRLQLMEEMRREDTPAPAPLQALQRDARRPDLEPGTWS